MHKHDSGKQGKQSGFTIVELLIVVVVIAILATVSIVAYEGIQTKADTAARLSEMTAWKRTFEVYKASESGWPSSMTVGKVYCLGKGFPVGAGGVARCRDYMVTASGYPEAENDALMAQIKTIAQIPDSPKKPVGNAVGPYAVIDSAGTLIITQIFSPSNTQCPAGTSYQYRHSSTLWCDIRLSQ
jgi:prepilin-type N-terminal cleavage/methylation domain-containing protein